jgi:hypothetical protein
MAKTASNSTLGAGSDFTAHGPARGFRSGDRDDSGMKLGGAERAGLFGGFFNPSRLAGAGIGTLVGGPIGGLIGGLIGGGFTSPRDLVDGGGPGASGPQFQGGLLSGLLNRAGVSPLGQGRRAQMAASPDLAPQGTRPMPAGATPVAERSFVPQQPASPTMAQPAPVTRPLTAQDVDMLTRAGMGFDAQVGLPATPEELAFLDARTGGVGPSAMTSVAQPGMNVMSDGEAFLRQNIAGVPAIGRPYVDTPQTDPRVDRSYRTMVPPTPQIQGFRPFPSTTTAPAVDPANLPAGSTYMPANQFTRDQLRAYRDMQARAAGGLLGR